MGLLLEKDILRTAHAVPVADSLAASTSCKKEKSNSVKSFDACGSWYGESDEESQAHRAPCVPRRSPARRCASTVGPSPWGAQRFCEQASAYVHAAAHAEGLLAPSSRPDEVVGDRHPRNPPMALYSRREKKPGTTPLSGGNVHAMLRTCSLFASTPAQVIRPIVRP
jgi:hypothetical protein